MLCICSTLISKQITCSHVTIILGATTYSLFLLFILEGSRLGFAYMITDSAIDIVLTIKGLDFTFSNLGIKLEITQRDGDHKIDYILLFQMSGA